jgi:phosphatidylinositol glycan class N
LRTQQHYLQRLVTIYLSFAPLFVLLSISYETLFYCCFSITLLLWINVEHAVYDFENNVSVDGSAKAAATPLIRKLSLRDAHIAAMFLFLVKVAFFGTGNVASLSSFSLQSVYRLTTVFDPFLMGALLLLKIFIPFFAVSAALRVITHNLCLPPFGPFLLVLATSDVMTLNFFYLVRDDGSWLEIGTTISHFCISSLFVLFMILLFALGHLLVGHLQVENVNRKNIELYRSGEVLHTTVKAKLV